MRLPARTVSHVRRLPAALAALGALLVLLVGVPWGLIAMIGWPLPDHLPTVDEVETAILNPLTPVRLVNVLACIAWPTWALFTIDVLRSVPDALHGIHPPRLGPIRAVTGVLLVTALVGVLPRGLAIATPAHPVTISSYQDTAAPFDARESTAPHRVSSVDEGPVVVQAPRAGVYDSLWRIADRALGDGHRWHELFTLNYGRRQPDGAKMTDPHQIRPGWILDLPTDDSSPETPTSQPETPNASAPAPQLPAPGSPVRRPVPDQDPAPGTSVSATSDKAITLVSGGFVAASLATATAAAMRRRRRQRQRTYRPGSGDRTPPPIPTPAVRALRLAYDDTHHNTVDDAHAEENLLPRTGAESVPQHDMTDFEVGFDQGRARALNLAALHGLGLTGPGAEAAARSLLVHLLATTDTTLVLPRNDAHALAGTDLPESRRLNITHDVDTAIAELDQRDSPTDTAHDDARAQVVLVASVEGQHQKLQSILEVGSDAGIGGILLGHWPPGATVRVRGDGIITATSPTLDDLRGSRLFHLDATDTRDLLDLLNATAPSSTPVFDVGNADESVVTPENQTEPDPTKGDSSRQNASESDSTHEDTRDTEPPDSSTPTNADVARDEGTELLADSPNIVTTAVHASSEADLPADDLEPAREHPLPAALSILGPLTLTWHSVDGQAHDLTSVLAPKHQALLVFLALHPTGTTRDTVREALWPEAHGSRLNNAYYAALSRIRKILSAATDEQALDLIEQHNEHVALNPDLVEVDYWHLRQAEYQQCTATTSEQRFAAWSRIVANYGGELADGMSALWLDGPREATHRTAVDALVGMAASFDGHDPQRRLQLLEQARELNPTNENLYRDIMRTQAERGLHNAISRTLNLLTTTLADIGERPDPSTLTLARALQNWRHTKG